MSDQEGTLDNARPTYEPFKTLRDGTQLVSRVSDGETFVAHYFYEEFDSPLAGLNKLFVRGAGEAVCNVLNHENLVSIDAALSTQPISDGGNAQRSHMLVWDYCDAGNLEQLLENPPVLPDPDGTGFLPEGLVWHVGLSVLRALQWLHEGIRDTYETKSSFDPSKPDGGPCIKVRGTSKPETDWLPILHRELHPFNIHFQQPRGIETYGSCKLGDFSNCYVSGTVSEEDNPPLIMHGLSETGVPIEKLRSSWLEWQEMGTDLLRTDRPYTRGCELYELGAVLYRMMAGHEHPDPEECRFCSCSHFHPYEPMCEHKSCPHWRERGNWARGYVLDEHRMYTSGLRDFVIDLLDQFRKTTRASEVLKKHWPSYLEWTQTTLDGQRHRDIFDDIHFRKSNTFIKEMTDKVIAKETLGVDLEGMFVG